MMPLKSKSSSSKGDWIASSFDDFDSFSSCSSTQSKTQLKSKTEKPVKKPSSRNQPPQSFAKQTKKDQSTLWVERHTPKTKDDLAVHKKKVADIEGWLQHNLKFKLKHGCGIALLTGPAGVGKTATVKVLSKELRLDLHEWSNPIPTSSGGDWSKEGSAQRFTREDFQMVGGYMSESQATQFREFLLRSNKYNSLQMSDDLSTNKIIMIEEFPNAFFRDTQQLHNILRDYRKRSQTPLLIILSDSAGGESNERLLFPPDLQDELQITNFSFNPVATTSMMKVLQNIATAEGSPMSGKAAFEPIVSGSNGDIRAAINALQFSSQAAKGVKRALQTTGSRAKKGKKSDKSGESEVYLPIGSKDNSLFLFRALGKILYCKRGDPSSFPPSIPLPGHLIQHERAPLLSDPEDVVERAQVSGSFFIAFLHQNYLDFFPHLDDVIRASEYLSDADFIIKDWEYRSKLQDYAASMATRGLMHSNTTRAAASGSGSTGIGWKPLHKPAVFGASRKSRENTLSARALFRDHGWTPVELQTQCLPFMAKLRPNLKPGQRAFLREVSRFQGQAAGYRNSGGKLDEKDIASLDGEDVDDAALLAGSSLPEETEIQIVQMEEEPVIEDFDF